MNEEELKALLGNENDSSVVSEERITKGLRKTQKSLGQQQTLAFVLIKIWVAVAKVLAPFFAGIAKQKANSEYNRNIQSKLITSFDEQPAGGKE